MKEFDISKVEVGDTLITRSGKSARILAFDFGYTEFSIVVEIKQSDDYAYLRTYNKEGKHLMGYSSPDDLFMPAVKVSRWINVYDSKNNNYCVGCLYETKKEAENSVLHGSQGYRTLEVSWEE